MKKFRSIFIAVLGTAITLFTGLSPALAATSSSVKANTGAQQNGQALEIAPPLITLTVNPGQTLVTQISIRDVSSGPLFVTGTVNDFEAAGEDGTPKILLNNNASTTPYSIKGWIASLPSLTLQPHEIHNLPITIKVPANASPGGHYGVIRFSGTPPELHDTGVSLQASLGSLVLVTVRGNIKHELSVQKFSVTKNGKKQLVYESPPLSVDTVIKNTGNVHEQPNGLVTIKDLLGKTIGSVNVNQPPKNVLPSSSRKFSEPLDKTVYGNSHLFGYYRAYMNLKYADGKTLVATTSFWVIPYKGVAIVIVLLVAIFFLLRYLLRRHDQRVMQQIKRESHYNRRK